MAGIAAAGSRWVVTGASAGIGEAIAAAAVARGAMVGGIARREGADVRVDPVLRSGGFSPRPRTTRS